MRIGSIVCAVCNASGGCKATSKANQSSRNPGDSIGFSYDVSKAGADYQGDALAVTPTAEGARLRCVFQRLEGEATREGLFFRLRRL